MAMDLLTMVHDFIMSQEICTTIRFGEQWENETFQIR